MKDKNYFDFFGEKEADFYAKFDTESILISGSHRDTPPLVTILIPTYKRVNLLKEALASALSQKNFDDYQIIVVDNEGAPIENETETSLFMKEYKDEKIIYYRHKESVSFRMDNAVKLARSKWIVFLHDDDVIDSNHLMIMTSIAKKYKKVSYVSCPAVEFLDGEYIPGNKKDILKYNYRLIKKNKNSVCLLYYTGWLGALIDREKYIATGGMPTLSNLLGDFCFVQKFHYRFGIHQICSNMPLYFARRWKGEVSSEGKDRWERIYRNQFEYYKYLNRKCHPITYRYWDRISAYSILNNARNRNRSVFRFDIDVEKIAKESGMVHNSLIRNGIYKKDIAYKIFYEEIFDKLFVISKEDMICL